MVHLHQQLRTKESPSQDGGMAGCSVQSASLGIHWLAPGFHDTIIGSLAVIEMWKSAGCNAQLMCDPIACRASHVAGRLHAGSPALDV